MAEQFAGWTPYHYVHQNSINLIDPTGMSADGWIEQNKDGKTTVTFDPKVNTTEEAVATGYKNVLQVLPSGSLLGQYNLNSDGSVCGEDVDWRRSQRYAGVSYFGQMRTQKFALIIRMLGILNLLNTMHSKEEVLGQLLQLEAPLMLLDQEKFLVAY